MRMNGFTVAAAAIFVALVAPAQALGPSGEEQVLAPETYSYGAPQSPDRPVSAFNGVRNEFLAVWEGNPEAGRGVAIFARRTLADGSPTGPVTPVSDVPGTWPADAAVAYDSQHDDYLVAWSRAVDPDDPAGSRAVFGQRLDGDATKLGEPFRISPGPSRHERHPAIGYDASRGRYLVAWSSSLGGGGGWPTDAIMARIVGADGAMTSPERVSLDERGSYSAEFPAVARDEDDDTFLVTWSAFHPYPRTTHFYGQLLDGEGAHADTGPDLQISEGEGLGGTVQQRSGLAYNAADHEFLAAFPRVDHYYSNEIAVQRIGPDGTKVAGTSNVGLGTGVNPQVSYGGNRYLVAFGSIAGSIGVVRGTLLDGDAEPIAGQSNAQLSACTTNAALTYGAGDWLLSWYGGGRRTGEETALLDLRAVTATAGAEPDTATACPPLRPTTPPTPPAGSEPDRIEPRIVAAAIRRRARDLVLAVRVSEPARLKIRIKRREIGRLRGGRCRKASRRNRGLSRCLRERPAGHLDATVGTDRRLVVLPRLPAGAYSATLVAVDPAGNSSSPVKLRFTSAGR
ncbi:MAG TPA: hypothetical protein VJT75_06235 [Thermoleophilaceae bacterium]|nr:hypothetical protein [Thermoleophilaceae bacterium]